MQTTILLLIATQTNTARLFAERIAVSVLSRVPKERVVKAVVQNISDLDVDSVLPSTAGETQPADGGSENALHLFVMATYTDGLPTESAKAFCQCKHGRGTTCLSSMS